MTRRRVVVYWALAASVQFFATSISSGQSMTTVRVAGGNGTANQLSLPLFVGAPPGDTSRLFIVEQRGVIRILDPTTNPPSVLATPFLDIDSLVTNLANGGDERGLLGLAFDPNFATNGFFYVDYTNNSSNTVIARYAVSPPSANVANAASAVILKTITQPFSNHNGGCLQFGPDGFMYVAMGDGGAACDPFGNGQSTSTLLGKLLRLNVNNPPTYVAAGNPYAGVGNPGLDEIWSIGLRNPFRFSFDRANGDLYIGDVGQDAVEEVDYVPAGSTGAENYGWDCCEGNIPLAAGSMCDGPSAGCFTSCATSSGSYKAPIYSYTHAAGVCVIGGYVYRGCAIAGLGGTYFFADYGSAQIWSFKVVSGAMTQFTNRTAQLAPGGGLVISNICSFGEDANGEVYICDRGSFSSATGEVYKIIPTPVSVASAVPANNTQDPRQDRNSSGTPQGLSQFDVTFSASTALCPGMVSVNCTGGTPCPTVTGVTGSGTGPYTVTLSGPVPPGHCTRFTFANTNTSIASNVVTYRFLPGDVDPDGTPSTLDLLAMVNALNSGTATLANNDIDRNGSVNTVDILRLVQLLNGVNTAQVWNGASLICPP